MNTAKTGITPQQASAITANTSKTGITPHQRIDITNNNDKVGYTDALVSANADVVANTAKTGITSAQATAITDDLKAFLLEQYKEEEITVAEVENIILDLEKFPASDLYESNKAIMKLVCDGFLLKLEDPAKKDL